MVFLIVYNLIFVFVLSVLYLLFGNKKNIKRSIVGFLIISIVETIGFYFVISNSTLVIYVSVLNVFIYISMFVREYIPILVKVAVIIEGKIFNDKEEKNIPKEVENAYRYLSNQMMGALIFEDDTGELGNSIENGVEINGACTEQLLETIFFNKTPLHDGAVILQKGKIKYAGCKLPLGGEERSGIEKLGTRHLVAMEITEKYNTKAYVLSEETGEITVVENGEITKKIKK